MFTQALYRNTQQPIASSTTCAPSGNDNKSCN